MILTTLHNLNIKFTLSFCEFISPLITVDNNYIFTHSALHCSRCCPLSTSFSNLFINFKFVKIYVNKLFNF